MSEQPRADSPVALGSDTRCLTSIEWQRHDTGWVAWVALLPILLLLVSVAAAGLEGNRWPMLGDVLITWVFVGAFGLVVFVPAMVMSLFGAAALKQQFRFGRRLASIGSAAVMLIVATLTYGIVGEALTPPERRDPYSWGPALSPFAASLVLVPYLVIAVANGYVITRLWKRSG